MPERFGEQVTVPRRAGGRIAPAARRDDEKVALYPAPVRESDFETVSLTRYAGDFRAEFEPYARLGERARQSVYDRHRLLRSGKDSPSPFGDEFDSEFFEKPFCLLGREGPDGGAQKLFAAHHLVEEFARREIGGEIAPALAGDIDLAAYAGVFFEKDDFRPRTREQRRGEASRRSSSHDRDFHSSHLFSPRARSISPSDTDVRTGVSVM